MKNKAVIELYIGPMFAGKTSRLITIYNDITNKIAIKPDIDNRYVDNMISSHDGDRIEATTISIECKDFSFLNEYDNIFVDEIQFLKHPMSLIKHVIKFNINLYMFGLSGTFNLNQFSTISKIIPYCTNIELLRSICYNCNMVANYSKKIIKNDIDKFNEIIIGGGDIYKPSCYDCLEHNFDF